MQIDLRPIGYVTTGFRSGVDVPSQAGEARGDEGEVVLLDELADGLDGLEGFDYAWLLTWFHELGQEPGERQRYISAIYRGLGRMFWLR